MRLVSPAQLYIKYLTLHPEGYTDGQIKEILEEADLEHVNDTYLAKVRARCQPPQPFHPFNKNHARSHRFILSEGVKPLFFPTTSVRTAFRILSLPRVKEFVEAMILSHAPPTAIAHAVMKSGPDCTSEDIEAYQKFFWNIDLLSSTQMRALLNYRQELTGDDSKEGEALKNATKKASYLDPRKLAAELPFSPGMALMSQLRMGLMPSTFEVAKTAETARALAVLRVMEAAAYGSPQDSQKAMNFAVTAKAMTDVLDKLVTPDEDLREKLQTIALRTETLDVPSIHQLSAGKHTVDLQPASNDEPEFNPALPKGSPPAAGPE